MNKMQQKAIGKLINKYQLKENELLKDYRQSKCDFVRHIISYRLSVYIDVIDDLNTIASQEQPTESHVLSGISQADDRKRLLEAFLKKLSKDGMYKSHFTDKHIVAFFLASNGD